MISKPVDDLIPDPAALKLKHLNEDSAEGDQ
jgi:hypothetical protein